MPSHDYIARQDSMDRVYREEHAKWLLTLSPAERAEAKRAGVVEADTSRVVGGISDRDAAERPEASETVDIAGKLDTTADLWLEDTQGMTREQAVRFCATVHDGVHQESERQATGEAVRKIAAAIIKKTNPRAQVYGLMFAVGLEGLEGVTMTEAAKKIGVTRAAVSKIAIWWRDHLGLAAPSAYMKPDASRKSYSKIQKANHWRRRKTISARADARANPENHDIRKDTIE